MKPTGWLPVIAILPALWLPGAAFGDQTDGRLEPLFEASQVRLAVESRVKVVQSRDYPVLMKVSH